MPGNNNNNNNNNKKDVKRGRKEKRKQFAKPLSPLVAQPGKTKGNVRTDHVFFFLLAVALFDLFLLVLHL